VGCVLETKESQPPTHVEEDILSGMGTTNSKLGFHNINQVHPMDPMCHILLDFIILDTIVGMVELPITMIDLNK
jgi:hypothetical protein